MNDLKFTDAVPISGTRMTKDGYLVADVLCARMGCQDYLAEEVGFGDGVVTIYRPEAAVFDKASLSTFAGKPVTLDHPTLPVTADNWKDLAVGDIGEEIARDGEAIRVSIKVMDAAAIQSIRDGVREISMGYSTPIKVEDGVAHDGTAYHAVQTGPIRINHLALVDKARGGSKLRIGDKAGNWGLRPTTSKQETMMSDALKTVVLGDKAVQIADKDVATFEAFTADAAKTLKDMKDAHQVEIDAKDTEIGKKDAELEKLKDAELSDADLDKRVAERASLLNDAASVDKDVKVEGLSDAEIRKAVVSAKLGDEAIKDRGDAYIEARFDVLVEDAKKVDPLLKPLADRAKNPPTDADPATTAYDKMVADMQGAYRQKEEA